MPASAPFAVTGIPWTICLPALLLCLILAACLTPRRWWARPTLLGIGGILACSYILARLWWQHTPAQSQQPATLATTAAMEPVSPPLAPLKLPAALPFRTHQALNLRQRPGTDAPLLATLRAGSTVWPTGARQGDWWQVNTLDETGWVSSLWLRQHTARARTNPAADAAMNQD